MEKNYYQITECPTLLANLVFDALVSRQQYAVKNRVMTIVPRLRHHERKLVKGELGAILDTETLIEECLIRHGVEWLDLVFKDGMVPRLADLVRFSKEEETDDISLAISAYINKSVPSELVMTLTIDELVYGNQNIVK